LTVAREQPYGFTMVTDKPDDGGVSPIAFYLDRGSGVPTYLQFVHQVDHALRLGYLRAGDQLPRIKDVTRTLAVNPDTVMKAYRELELRGIAAGRPGVGTFITRAPDIVGLKQLATLRKKLSTWLAEAAEAGVDELGMKALFTAALRDFSDGGAAGRHERHRDGRPPQALPADLGLAGLPSQRPARPGGGPGRTQRRGQAEPRILTFPFP
jgi:GntR family transcriptional regulator